MTEKLSKIENILFIIFLVTVPTAFYISKYPTCYSVALRHDSFYFYLELIVFFALLFIVFSCFPHHFIRPLLTKNIFLIFSVIFIPWICYYASSKYFYAPYCEILIYGIVLVGMLCLAMPAIPEPKPNAKEIFSVLNTLLLHYILICPVVVAIYLCPIVQTSEIIDDPKFLFIFASGASVICYAIFLSFNSFKFILPYYSIFKTIAILFLIFFIPYFIYSGTYNNNMLKYGFFLLIIWVASYGLFKFILLDLPTNEDGFPIREPHPPGEN